MTGRNADGLPHVPGRDITDAMCRGRTGLGGVQAPHAPWLHRSFVPVRPRCSRKASSNEVRGSSSSEWSVRLTRAKGPRFSPRSCPRCNIANGAPRSMKMGTIRSPCPYDPAVRHALQSANLRRPAILYCPSWGGCLPDFAGWSGYPSIPALSINPGIDVMGQQPTCVYHR
jgi:hypothetical protein